jgi:methylenetetrahydrofolate reductase (NADPH)
VHIAELIARRGRFVSLEFFPPKEPGAWPAFFEEVGQLKVLDPLFASVTYGAGGSTQANTLDLVTILKRGFGLEPMAHLTCVGAAPDTLHAFLGRLTSAGVDNVLALRGDPPKGAAAFVPDCDQFRHSTDLVRFIRANYRKLGIGVAGYPEKHPEAPSLAEDIRCLKAKIETGGNFVITQLFFDNQAYFDFVAKAREAGVDAPIIPGILPILSLASIKRILSLCDAAMPPEFLRSLEQAQEQDGPEAVKELGIAFARNQIRGLLDRGAPGVHLYTLNKAEACLKIVQGLGSL